MVFRIVLFATAVFLLSSIPSNLVAGEWYVDASVAESGDGKTWATAFKEIQEGINTAIVGDTVIVAEGTYVENIHFNGKNIVLRSTDPLSPGILAGTVIDGNGSGSVVTFAGTENGRCALSGFTIRNGRQDEKLGGGGIHGAGTRARITYNRILGNGSSGDGGGIYDCDGIIARNLIAGNGSVGGGGLACCDGIIEDNIIAGNNGVGGGLLHCVGTIRTNKILHNRGAFGAGLFNCGGTIEHNIVAGNQAEGDPGGGLCECTGTVRNNLIVGNCATWRGGGVAFGEGLLLNNTIAANRAGVSGGGIANHEGDIVNCVIWGNRAASDSQIHDSTTPTYSCIEDWTGGGEGNITDSPMFLGWSRETGRWTDAPTFDETTWQTTLADTWASWVADDFKGLVINPQTSQPLQFVIASNTETTINVWGHLTELANAGDRYDVVDYGLDPQSPCVDAGDNAVDAGRFDLDGNYRCIGTKGKPGWTGKVDYIEGDVSGDITVMWKGFIDVGAYECRVRGPVPETYAVQTRERMESADWIEVFSGKVSEWTDQESTGKQKFYRVETK